MRSTSTSEKPMMALSGVRSSCDMLARNSDLCLAGRRQLLALVLDLSIPLLQLGEQPHVLDRDHGLIGERLSSAICVSVNGIASTRTTLIAPMASPRISMGTDRIER